MTEVLFWVAASYAAVLACLWAAAEADPSWWPLARLACRGTGAVAALAAYSAW